MTSATISSHEIDVDSLRKKVVDAISAGQLNQADADCTDLLAADATEPDAWVFRARIAQKRSDFVGANQACKEAVFLAPTRLDVMLVHAECQMFVGRIKEALETLDRVAGSREASEDDFKRASALYTQLGRHQKAYNCAVKAMEHANKSLNSRYLVASAAIAVGKMQQAEHMLDEIIAENPTEGDIYYNRAALRRQTKERNHITQIMKRLIALPEDDISEAPLCYALGKEFEDIGDHAKAFSAFAQGAASRRKRLTYDVKTDMAAADHIIQTFNTEWHAKTPDGTPVEGPIFILGLPRSGTTLVDRIVSAHSGVSSLEEVHDFAYGVIRAGYPASSKEHLAENASTSDMASLGAAYWEALKGYGEPGPYLIDKTPANYLYLGLIAKALPNAKIIHVRRHPLASCYAMFKTLFRMGYPFSYDLEDIARYYQKYHGLMAHWRTLFPGRVLDVDYEGLIDTQESVSRKIITHCGLEWEDACLNFHTNAAPTATASAAQVRQPIYRSARDIWRNHAAALAPATRILEESGISCA